MRPTPFLTRPALLFCLCLSVVTFASALNARATTAQQPQSDRPPWARKNKSNTNSTPSGSSGSTTSSNTTPPPIVNPTDSSSTPADDPASQENQRGRIRVSVNLVNVLA